MPMNAEERQAHFYVGQKVRVRQWDDMVEQYGCEGDSIPCNYTFVEGMIQYCGRELTIREIAGNRCWFKEDVNYNWSLDMIEDIEPEPAEPEFTASEDFMGVVFA